MSEAAQNSTFNLRKSVLSTATPRLLAQPASYERAVLAELLARNGNLCPVTGDPVQRCGVGVDGAQGL